MSRTLQGKKTLSACKRLLRQNLTEPERRLWLHLRCRQLAGLKFRRQHAIGSHIVDFFCPERKIVIELDGETHGHEVQREKDDSRDAFLGALGIRVLRFTNEQVIKELEAVLEDVLKQVKE